ncbi:MAG: exonuclease SbcCD subunit D C-terminal domain-containing protein, partial [Actinomycetota bacterium]|nr:exonuclease SbcCD subunit D C-terminal domain-containing protein [Actinomycetota bacterium]
YSGSLLPYSFSEDHAKSVRLVDVADGAVTGVREVPIPVGRPVITLEGRLGELLDDPGLDVYLDHWVAVRLTDDTVQVQPMERLRSRFPHAVNVRYAPGRADLVGGRAPEEATLEERSPEEMVLAFLAELRDRPPTDVERELVAEAMTAAAGAGPSGQGAAG